MIEFRPANDYKGLLLQARALHTVAKSYERQMIALGAEVKSLKTKLAFVGEEAINAERSTNEMLTNELSKMKELQG